MKGRDILIAISVIENGNWDNIYKRIKEKYTLSFEEVDSILLKIKSKTVTIIDEDYPESLKNISKPPFVLFYYGDLSLASSMNNNVAIVGSRNNSDYGANMTRLIVSGLESDLNVVSGLAIGIDSIAHESAINSNLKTIAVLGCGIDSIYPKRNKTLFEKIKQSHLLISEYPGEVEPLPTNFPVRNRIIAGLSWGVVIVEALKKSGSMITAYCALQNGKEVMCVPSEANKDSGTNMLIADGARLIECGKDVNEERPKYSSKKDIL